MLIQNTLGVIVDSKKYTLFFWSATVLHRVEEILGCAGTEIPRGTDTFRITLKLRLQPLVDCQFVG